MNCFKKRQRLLKKSEFDRVFKQAKKIVTSDFVILSSRNTLGYARLGLALSKKIIPKAHDRNRIKRLLREGFRTTQLPPIDLIFLAKQGLAEAENKVITTRLGSTWHKLIALYVS